MKTTWNDNEKSLLIFVRGDRLGDALIKLPAIATLRNSFPDHHITWMTGVAPSIFKTSLSPLVKDYVDQVIEMSNIGVKWSDLFTSNTHDHRYRFIIDTQNVIRTTVLLRRIPHEVFVSQAAFYFFSDRQPKEKKEIGNKNIQKKLLMLISLLSGIEPEPVYKLNLPPEYRELASQLLPEGPVYVGFAPGAGDRKRCWPLERYIELAKQQVQSGRKPVFFIGPQEIEMMADIKSSIEQAIFPEHENKAQQLRGPLLSLALAERLTIGVANDSGPGHIVAAGGQPVVSLYGPSDVKKFAGTSNRQLTINARDFGGKDMELIPFSVVMKAANDLLESSGRI